MNGSEAQKIGIPPEAAQMDLVGAPDAVVISFSGNWNLALPLPSVDLLEQYLKDGPSVRSVTFAAERLSAWDTGLLAFVHDAARLARRLRIEVNFDGLPPGVRRLMGLVAALPEKESGHKAVSPPAYLDRVGGRVVNAWSSSIEALTFLGDVAVAFFNMCIGRARFRAADLMNIIQECGAGALPIVSLICVLVGLILAFVGSIQLRMFGAQIYIADLVGISMTRAMGAIMTGIIMSGRTGASFAARIGTMQVNEEIDALRTTGIPPVEFLVLPRVLGLAIMMPLLTLYADLMGMLGGLIVSVTGFDMSFVEYFNETRKAVTLGNIGIGCFSGLVFGVLIALAGCLRGMQCGRSASAVGDTTTSAVVTGIVSIIIATAIITVACDVLGV